MLALPAGPSLIRPVIELFTLGFCCHSRVLLLIAPQWYLGVSVWVLIWSLVIHPVQGTPQSAPAKRALALVVLLFPAGRKIYITMVTAFMVINAKFIGL